MEFSTVLTKVTKKIVKVNKFLSEASNSNCETLDQFKCKNNGGIICSDKICDGFFDCQDHSDELHCCKINLI